MSTRIGRLDPARFGPWAVVTGASSGIGREFASQLAANQFNLILAARRLTVLQEIGADLTRRHGVWVRPVQADLADPDELSALIAATDGVDVGLLVSNAGDMLLGEFLAVDHDPLLRELRLNAEAHLRLTHHVGRRLAERGSGGILLVSSVAAIQGVPYTANYAASKAYPLVLGEAVHHELARSGVHLTVLLPGATDTPMIRRFGADQTPMGRRSMPVDVCVRGGLSALRANRALHVSGRLNRLALASLPRAARVRVFGGMTRSMARRATTTPAPSERAGSV
jgi:short-subunit dehydrogenase